MKNRMELREEIKRLAAEQKALRPQIKESYEGERTHRAPHPWETPAQAAQAQKRRNKADLRNMHVAYCLLRGTPFEEIERKQKEGKPGADFSVIEKIMEECINGEAVCSRAS